MKYWRITYEWHSRPRYRVGHTKTCHVTFAAGNRTDAYRLAQEDGAKRFPRHKWKVVSCEDFTPYVQEAK